MVKYISIFVLLFFLGCSDYNKEVCKIGLPEKHYDFIYDIKRQPNYDYLDAIIVFRQFGSSSKNKWLKKPENLKTVYGSLKQIGLKRFISDQEFNKPLFTDHWAESCWANKSLNQITESLIQSYFDTSGHDNYYEEFWNRRKVENNDKVVFQILTDIQSEYQLDKSYLEVDWKSEPVINGLLEFEVTLKESDSLKQKEVKIEYHRYLKSIGLYSSANNLLRYENDMVNGVLDDKDNVYMKLINEIETDSVDCENYWNWRESSEWFNEIIDYNH